MPPAPLKLKYVIVDGSGLFRYNRTIPQDCRAALGRKMWNLSLGRDADEAARRAMEHRKEHDALIARLRDPMAASVAIIDIKEAKLDRIRDKVRKRLEAAPPDPAAELAFEEKLSSLWRNVPVVIGHADAEPDLERRAHHLASFLYMAFGDSTWLGAGVERPDTPPPESRVERMLYDAHHQMLRSEVEKLVPAPDPTPEADRLTGVLARYLALKNRRGNTATSYRKKIARFVAFAGDRDLQDYDAAKMRAYRDHLSADLKPNSLAQYFAALKTLWAWAPTEIDRYQDLTFPRVTLPERATTVEDDRWQAFTDAQIKKVWQLLNEAWGPDAASRLSPGRRRAFLMAVRVLLYTGLRPVEVFHLTADNIEGDTIVIRHTKTKAGRVLPLSKHIADLPDFLAGGGFEAELRAGIGRLYRGVVQRSPAKPESLEGTMRDAFREVIRAGGVTHEKLVLYSLKDTLIRRLQGLDVSDDLMRGVIGHSTGQKALRNYKTPFGQSREGLVKMRKALDAIVYW